MELLKHFFDALGERLTHENSISDVLYAALCSSEAFSAIVGKHLKFPEDDRPQIEREYDASHGRPDFRFTFPKTNAVHLVEVKLYDRNYHYDEYCQIRVSDRNPTISLLTAHKPGRCLDPWNVVSWEVLIGDMEESDDAFVQYLGGFFRKAIMIGKLARIDLQNPKALLYMNRALKTVIKNYQSAAFEAEIKMGSKTFDEDRSGYEYMLKSTSNSQHFAWVRFQIVYQEHAEGIWIWFSKGGNATWYERIKATLLRHYPTSLAEEPARDACYVLMTQEAYNAFLSCGSVEEQLRLLADFFADVNRGIEGAFAAPSTIHSEH